MACMSTGYSKLDPQGAAGTSPPALTTLSPPSLKPSSQQPQCSPHHHHMCWASKLRLHAVCLCHGVVTLSHPSSWGG